MTIKIDYYIRDSLLYIDMADDCIVFKYEWSNEILVIRETIPFTDLTEENLLTVKEDMCRQYEAAVKKYYLEKTEKHLTPKEAKQKVDEFFASLIGKK